jgi:hypothetical protein
VLRGLFAGLQRPQCLEHDDLRRTAVRPVRSSAAVH